jgi:exopolyphosphatase / guanosine-5'-triphosphate,3'-diphosphate pyrophosphatase
MPTFAAVDIGANSVRLKVARLVRQRLQTVHEDREVVRLGESVFQTGMLAPAAMAQTVKVLRRFHKAVMQHGDGEVRVVATSALRDAGNAQAFIDWVHMRTGWRVEVISGIEEARLIHLGIITNLRVTASPLLLIDLGGGSCELTISARRHIRETVSLPLGAVRLTQEFLHHDPPRDYELHRLYSFIAEEAQRVARRIVAARPQAVIATSGTAAALATSAQSLLKHAGKPNTVPTRALVRLTQKLSRMSYAQRIKIPGIGTRRGEIIVAGAAVFADLMQRCDLAGFRYSDLGLRDGLLAQMAADYTRTAKGTRQLESERWDALVAMARRYHVDMEQVQHVRSLTMQLFAGLKAVHQLPPEYAEWLSAAAILHEIGAYVNRTGWHRHAYYLISNSEILGYTPAQRQTIAAITRYLGSALPAPSDKLVKSLAPEDREHVPKAVALLRVGRALNQGRRRAVTSVRTRTIDSQVTLRISPRRGIGADLERWALKKERTYFRTVFGRELEVAVT